MKRLLMIFIFGLFLSGCSPKIAPERVVKEYIEKEVLRDTIIYVPIYREVLVNRVKDTSSLLQNKYCISTANVDSTGYLNHTLATIAQDIPFKVFYKDKLVVRRDSVDRPFPVKGDTITREIVPKWCWWLLGVNCLLAVFAAIKIYLKIKA